MSGDGNATAATYTLEIRFKCLCLLVRDARDSQNTRVHVVMPTTHETGVDRHVVQMMYPRAGGPLLNGTADSLPMDGWQMEFPGNGTAPVLDFGQDLVNISANAGPVRDEVLGSGYDPSVASRMTLVSGEITERESAATWEYDGVVRPLTQQVTWTIRDIPGDRLVWRRTRIRAEGEPTPDDVQDLPVIEIPADANGKRLIHLDVYHITASDFPTPRRDREPCVSADHFVAYYPLFENPTHNDKPRFKERLESPTISCINGGAVKP